MGRPAALLLVLALSTAACAAARPGDPLLRMGDEISICGALYHTGARVVLWNDPGGFDAYRLHRRFAPEKIAPSGAPDRTSRYGSFRGGLSEEAAERVRREGWRLDDLREAVTQVVIHYDAAGTSRRCFEVLHDIRGLSSHFLLDVDGTIYQTLDVKERAWHAGPANDRSVGIEIANLGAYPPGEDPDFPPKTIRGRVQGRELIQIPFTDAQYDSLIGLVAALCRVLDVPAEPPRDPEGRVRPTVLPDEAAIRDFTGILGHHHVSAGKVDPGPAFDWDRLLAGLAVNGLR